MPDLIDLYQHSSYWLWLGLGAVFVALSLITGARRLMWPGAAAAVVSTVGLAGASANLLFEVGGFLVLTLAFLLLPRRTHNPRPIYVVSAQDVEAMAPRDRGRGRIADSAPFDPGAADLIGRLVGRIGKTTGEFANGVGRVWIEGAEWSADLESGDDLHPGTPVRITQVNGGVRLQVCTLNA